MNIFYNLKSGKNTKLFYYLRCSLRELIPSFVFQSRLNRTLEKASKRDDYAYMCKRVEYYNKLQKPYTLEKGIRIKDLKKGGISSVYYYDTVEFTRWFKKRTIVSTDWGDVTYIPSQPSIVKSRPIKGDNTNSVVMKLEKIRHFLFVKDPYSWGEKENRVIFRGKIPGKKKRERFFDIYFGNPLCDLGDTSRNGKAEWKTGKRTIDEHLRFKFILALEGNDVASNLKWVMSSGSAAVMPKPEFETWFMEGTLIPNYHYIEIKEDFSDLEERINYYINHEEEAKEIVRNANLYVQQFKHPLREKLISLMTLNKYISLSTQKDY